MRFDVLTLFPEMFAGFISHSIIGRAVANGLICINPINIRAYSTDKHLRTDDAPYGGGSGMVMTVQPIADAIDALLTQTAIEDVGAEEDVGSETGKPKEKEKGKPKVIYLSPQGKPLTQQLAMQLKEEEHLILLCGHYEGIDERIIDLYVDEEISVGDYVLTGGEVPAMVLMDCVSRLLPGVLGDDQSSVEESHTDGLLEYPHYTRPAEFQGLQVPEILLSGHHANIEQWRFEKSVERTRKKRPDLYRKYRRRMNKEKGDQ